MYTQTNHESDNGLDIIPQREKQYPSLSVYQKQILRYLTDEDCYIGIEEGLDGLKCSIVVDGNEETVRKTTFERLRDIGLISGTRMALEGCNDYYQYKINGFGMEVAKFYRLA